MADVAPATTPPAKTAKTVDNQAEADEAIALVDWMTSFGEMGEMRVTLRRISPPSYKGVPCKGLLQHYDFAIDEKAIKDQHGGGLFTIQVERRGKSKKGNPTWVYLGTRRFEIAGVPKLDNLLNAGEDPLTYTNTTVA